MTLQDIFATNPMQTFFEGCQKSSKVLTMHITGKNMKDEIQTMEEFETEQKKNLRQKYTRSNRDIFTRIHRPIDKVFSANGGSVILKLPDTQKKTLQSYLGSVRKGMSLRKWVQRVALPAYQMDPNGLIFIEQDEDGKPYPTYKSTKDIFYYETDGRNITQVIFRLSAEDMSYFCVQIPAILEKAQTNIKDKKATYYRIVDDKTDQIVEWDGKGAPATIGELELSVPFGQCPAIIVSDIFQFNNDELLSPDADIVELANSILTDNSVFEIWKKLHMFPKHWRMQSVCPTCQGNKVVAGVTCTNCNGTGFQVRSSVRDEIVVPMPDSTDGKITLPNAFDGYSTPPIDAWTLATNDYDRLYNFMFQTAWGYAPKDTPKVKVDSEKKTATQVLDEGDNKSLRLYDYSAWAESIETFIIDMIGICMFKSTYDGCSVHYGDRYVIEGPDELWQLYAEARQKGASQSVLDNLLRDYYESKYYGDPMGLQKALKQMRIEPWVHSTINQVQAYSATEVDKTCKTYFSEWCSTIPDMDWYSKQDEALRAALVLYATPKVNTIKQQAQDDVEFQRQLQAKAAPANNAAI